MITEFWHTARGEALAVYFHEGFLGKVTVRAVLLKSLVPFLDGVLGVVGVVCQEVDVFFRKSVSGLLKCSYFKSFPFFKKFYFKNIAIWYMYVLYVVKYNREILSSLLPMTGLWPDWLTDWPEGRAGRLCQELCKGKVRQSHITEF